MLSSHCEQLVPGWRKATQWTADPFYPGSIPGFSLGTFL